MRSIISSLDNIDAFVAAFRDRTLPKTEWTHEAHFVTALWHIRKFGHEEGSRQMRDSIPLYNEAVGG